jgi:hypothetical protein
MANKKSVDESAGDKEVVNMVIAAKDAKDAKDMEVVRDVKDTEIVRDVKNAEIVRDMKDAEAVMDAKNLIDCHLSYLEL